jgi:gamma-glutamyl-gamma-aminobutyrate hydrolase PuuD
MTHHSIARDGAEFSFARAALLLGLPTLGICRGMQGLAVALGGTLHPDHSVLEGSAALHPGGCQVRTLSVSRTRDARRGQRLPPTVT